MSKFITLDDINVKDKTVIIRVDLNVPMKDGKVIGKERIERCAPTIAELSESGAKVVVLSHLGRPKGEGYEEEFSLKPVSEVLSQVLNKPVTFVSDCIGESAQSEISKATSGDILLLENVRFYKEETKNNSEFTKKLASLGDIFVSDAFSAAHRAHSSTVGLATELPYAAGRLMQAELEALETALGNPKRPVAAIVGGAKISTKLDVLNNMVKKVDIVIVGGGMANTFLAAAGVDIGKSLCEHDMKDQCNQIMHAARENSCLLALPVDARVATELKENVESEVVENNNLPEGHLIFDAGDQSLENFTKILGETKTVIWNGPLGVFEIPPFNKSTFELAKVCAELTKNGTLTSIAGGGDTVSALQMSGTYDDFTYVSTAGGAFLEWMEGKELPGVKCLEKK